MPGFADPSNARLDITRSFSGTDHSEPPFPKSEILGRRVV